MRGKYHKLYLSYADQTNTLYHYSKHKKALPSLHTAVKRRIYHTTSLFRDVPLFFYVSEHSGRPRNSYIIIFYCTILQSKHARCGL